MKPELTPEEIAERKKLAAARKAARIREALANFDAMPDAGTIDVRVFAALLGCSVPTVWRRVSLELLPAPVRVSPGSTRWRVGDARAHLKGLPPAVGTNLNTQHARNVLAAQRSAQASAA